METLVATPSILFFKDKQFPLLIGRSGITLDKKEGDGATPAGLFPLRRLFYRADRLPSFKTALPCYPIYENDGWSDDVLDPLYNRKIPLPHPYHHERLWREDNRYDLLIEIGYNDRPAIPGKGSAIFLHLQKEGALFTRGCLAISLEAMMDIVTSLPPVCQVLIKAEEDGGPL